MEQNDAEVNQVLNVCSGNGEGQKSGTQLRSRISLSNFQMLQLTHNDQKFTDRVSELNQRGINSIHLAHYQDALLYLTEAQKLLQYAASCGRAIDRQIILIILNNEAVVYQKTWDLQRSISYIQAIIFNLHTFLNSRQSLQTVQSLNQKHAQISQRNSSFSQEDLEWYMESQFDKLKSLISKKYQLALYFLQFSCLNSQNQDHQIGLKNAHDSLNTFKEAFHLSAIFLKLKKTLNIPIDQQTQKLLNSIAAIHPLKIQRTHDPNKQMEDIQKAFECKSHPPNSFNYILQKYSSFEKKESKCKNFSLTSVMELHPKSMGEQLILDQSKNGHSQYFIDQIENFASLTEKVLEYAVAFFTISVEIKELGSNSVPSPSANPAYAELRQDEHQQKMQQSQSYYILALKISVQLVDELSQFSRYIYKHYFEIYSQEKASQLPEAMSKMDSLIEKYKKYLPDDKKKNSSNLYDSDDDFCDNTFSEYSISIRAPFASNPKDSKENKLEKLFKENVISTPQNAVNHAPPRLNVDISEIESLEYGGSKTFKQTNNQVSNNLSPHEIIEEEEEDNKQTKKLNCLNVKKIKTVPNLSDLSSDKDSESLEKEKSSRSKSRADKVKKSKQKFFQKKNVPKKSLKSNSNTSRQKSEIKRFMSPKNFNRKSFQADTSNKSNKGHNEIEGKKKTHITEKKIFSDRKTVINTGRSNEKSKNKKLLVFKDKKKKLQTAITPQPSARNVSQRDETERIVQKRDEKLRQTKKLSKLRKAKSFEQIIHPYEDIKPIIYQSKDISDTYHIYQGPKLKEKLKLISEVKKVKSNENLKFTVKNGKKERKKSGRIEGLDNKLSQNTEGRNLLQTKDSGIKKKGKSGMSRQKEGQYGSVVGLQNAVRMSSASNLLNSGNDKSGMKKLSSSKSLHDSNYSSGYLLKGLNVNASQRTKAQSMAMTKSLRRKG